MNGVRDGDSGSSSSRSGLIMFNGATYDRQYNNTQGTLLASAARTATTYTPVQTNYNARGVIIYLNVTSASGTGGLDVIVLSVDPISGNTFPINATPTSVTSTGLSTYVIYPGISGGSNTQSTSQILPRTWEIKMTQLDSSSYTYSLGYQLIL